MYFVLKWKEQDTKINIIVFQYVEKQWHLRFLF